MTACESKRVHLIYTKIRTRTTAYGPSSVHLIYLQMQTIPTAHEPALHLSYPEVRTRTTAHGPSSVHLIYLQMQTRTAAPDSTAFHLLFTKVHMPLTCPRIDLGAPHPQALLPQLVGPAAVSHDLAETVSPRWTPSSTRILRQIRLHWIQQ
jgi:hypothetical protein